LDENCLSTDSRAHRATRMAPHLIEKVGHGGREKRSARGGSISRPDCRRWRTFWKMGCQPRGGLGASPCDAFRTAEGARGASRGLFNNARERGLGSKSQMPVDFYSKEAIEWHIWSLE